MSSLAFCRALPKLELHAHLNGSVRYATICDLYQKKLATNADVKKFTIPQQENRDIQEAFKIFGLIHMLVDNHQNLARITREMIEDFANDGVIYLEIRTTPKSVPATGMTKRSYVETVVSTIKTAQTDDRILVGLLLSLNRNESLDQARETVALAHEFSSKGVVGIDFSGNPEHSSFSAFRPVLDHARSLGLKTTIHFAEARNEKESHEMLDFRPDRIGHACYLDEGLRARMDRERVPLELCLTSNVKTQSVPSYVEHHFRHFYKTGYPLALCTDDWGIFGSLLSQEYHLAAHNFHLSDQQLLRFSEATIDLAFQPETVKEQLRQKFKIFSKNVQS